jgi:hypothetical protein
MVPAEYRSKEIKIGLAGSYAAGKDADKQKDRRYGITSERMGGIC